MASRSIDDELNRLRTSKVPIRPIPSLRQTPVPVQENQAFQESRRKAALRTSKLNDKLSVREIKRQKQQHRLRLIFTRWLLVALSVVIAGSLGIFGWYMIGTGGKPTDTAMVAWLSSTVVETIGLGYVLAKYLFGEPPPQNKREALLRALLKNQP